MGSERLKSFGIAVAVLATVSLAVPAQAQFSGLLSGSRNRQSNDNDKCSESNRSVGSRIAGGIIGSLASRAAGSAGSFMSYVPVAEFTDQLTASIACRLAPEEQKQAANATLEATRSADGSEDGAPEVGQMAAWTSDTRSNVMGSSTVTDSETNADGLQCLRVTDVIIVDGEETRAEKRMCRRPPAVRYTIAA